MELPDGYNWEDYEWDGHDMLFSLREQEAARRAEIVERQIRSFGDEALLELVRESQ